MEKYTVIRKIGEGAFGEAILARAKPAGKQVVIKKINMNKVCTDPLSFSLSFNPICE